MLARKAESPGAGAPIIMLVIQLALAIFTGITAGLVTGLIPGIHVNLISVLLISISPMLLNHFSPYALALFIIAMSITHTFLDIIPSIFLGAPNEDTALAVLPGHVLLLEGKGYEAIRLATIGSILSLLFGVIIFPLLIFIVPRIYELIKPYIGYLLIGVVAYLFFQERGKAPKAIAVFLIAGLLGYTVLNFPNLHNPLFPLLSGIFGLSILLNSLFEEAVLPKQYITEEINIDKTALTKSIASASFSGWLTSMFPGIGPAHAAIISKSFYNMDSFSYIIVIGGINTVNFLFSLVTFYTINKARNGAVIAVQELTTTLPTPFLFICIAAVLIIGGLATILTLTIAKFFANILNKVNYRILCLTIIASILFLTIYLSSWIGLFILIISTALGLFTHHLNVKKSHAMGCLLLPVIIFFVF